MIDWGNCLVAPEALIAMMTCLCTTECVEETCICLQNKRKCIYLCKLAACANRSVKGEDEIKLVSVDEDDTDSDTDSDED